MKPYSELTNPGIKKRLGQVVKSALKVYNIIPSSIRFLDEATNLFYKITDEDGVNYAAKVVQDEWVKIEDNIIEAHLLEQISKKCTVKVPRILINEKGEPVTIIEKGLTPKEERVMIYQWFEGEDIDGNESDENFEEMGRVTAHLHNALEGTHLPENMTAKKWDRVFYFRGECAVYKQEAYQSVLTKEYHDTMGQVIDYLDSELPKLYENKESFVIHGDLNPWNMKINGSKITVFDFEDNIEGTPLHDIAIMLYYYWYDEKFDFNRVKKHYLKGYQEIKGLPVFSEFELELLMTARRVNFLNYILKVSEDPRQYIKQNLPRVIDFKMKYM